MVIKLKGVTCKADGSTGNSSKLRDNDLFNGGCANSKDPLTCWVLNQYIQNENKYEDVILGHCRESQAAMVFMFMATVLLLLSALMGFLRRRKGY